ncbi:aryl-alcohol dehydrogenase-like predicted oxidoreductase [Streptomyces sp. SAI-135]|uniref:aldo/keto reductase n=1 Tax=unclassified Streptomyces TaxID=2593676 RepID=UPI002474F3DF|nr:MULTISPECIES: aldo/keto reductase [unclassified Streptomyces]MDH6522898.1 aryl-alcohol dehydrogenase-like predicted oxidoreductase [Streptomyces sp. SAI-090]MDH6613488.1 aryl-alcohol dehydrogenase-like predicted oxidoreductase [Streptomyces sp. SAI-135]
MTELRTLGSSGLRVSPLCLGGNVFGWTADKTQSFAVLDAYLAAGGNFIDTADSYMHYFPEQGNEPGQSESIIGDWLASRRNRDDVVIATKVGDHPKFMGLAPANIKAAVEESLRRLRTDHIDLYYTHFDRDESIPVDEIITALDDLVKAGKVRAIATSNISPERLSASLEFSDREGLARYVALQPQYNLIARDSYEGARREIVQREGLVCVPYFALASGFLTGKYRPGKNTENVRNLPGLAGGYADTERGVKVLDALEQIATARGVEMATVAVAWLAQQPTVIAPIASARTVEQLPALLAAQDLQLSDTELETLTTASS